MEYGERERKVLDSICIDALILLGTRMEASLIVRSALIWIQTMLHWKKARKGATKEDCGFKSGA